MTLPGSATPPSTSSLTWRTSSFCSSNSCVQLAALDGGGVGVRDSKANDDLVLRYSANEFADFVRGVKDGEFDDLCLLRDGFVSSH